MKNKSKYRVRNRLWNKRFMAPVRLMVKITKRRMDKNIRFAIMVVFAICFFIAMIAYFISNIFFGSNDYRVVNIKDRTSISSLLEDFNTAYRDYTKDKNVSINKSDMDKLIVNLNILNNDKVIVADFNGKVLYKYGNVTDSTIDINKNITNAIDISRKEKVTTTYMALSEEELVAYRNITFESSPSLVFLYTKDDVRQSSESTGNKGGFASLVIAIITFIVCFSNLTRDKMKYINNISVGVGKIASGDLEYRIEEVGEDEISKIARNINSMAKQINNRMEKERRAEKTKNDLITNVSHDLRTPLTSVMGYIGLVKEGKYENEEQMKEYLDISFKKSEKIKVLMEDLFEYTKLSNAAVKLEKTEVDIGEFLSQLIEEYMPVFDENELNVVKNIEGNLRCNIDTNKMLRVFENMISNAIKYATKPCDFEISVAKIEEKVRISFANRCEHIPKEKIDKLFDRFYRIDESRNSSKATGSGLGLAISKNIISLHGGNIWADYVEDKIIFIIEINYIS